MKGARIKYSADELAWVRNHAHLARVDLHVMFVQVFGRSDVTSDNIKALCSRKGWSAGPEGRRRNKGKSLIMTPDQVAWIRENAHLSRADVEAAFQTAFPGSTLTADQIVRWRKTNKVRTGRTGRFEKGSVPWTKGRKMAPHPNSQATQIKTGNKPHNARPIGYESRSRDGYILVCVNRPNPFTGARTHMAFKHKELWISANGPIPEGHALKCLDGDKTNCEPSNWEAIPKGLLPRLNSRFGRDYDTAPAELKPTILAIAKLEHKAREAGKGREK